MRILGKAFDYLEETLIVIGLAFMTVMNFVNVVSRYCFANSFSFTEELTVLAFVWISMLGIATGFKRYSHLGMSYFVDMFPKRLKALMSLFYLICALIFMYVMLRYGVEVVKSQIRLDVRTPALGLPAICQSLAMPVGGAFIIIRIIQSNLVQFWKSWTGRGVDEDPMLAEAQAMSGIDEEELARHQPDANESERGA